MLRRISQTLLLALILAACGPGRLPDQVVVSLYSDGEVQTLTLPQGQTVRDALKAASLTLGELDRVRPPETTLLLSGQTISVTRVVQTSEIVTDTIPFQTRYQPDTTLAVGEQRVMQAGRNGTTATTYRLTYEDGQLISRVEIDRQSVQDPVVEIIRTGPTENFDTVPLSGTLVYLSNNNAFIMREVSGNRRPLTTAGDLDGRVVSLSPDGKWLLYTRAVSKTLNALWIVDTTLATPEPKALNLTGILWADFSPDGKSIAYSRGDPAPGLPGWKAFNDLSIVPINNGKLGKAQEIVKAASTAQYAWWGTQYRWSPDSKRLAFANTEAIGVISPTARLTKTTTLITFAAYNTRSTWAWTPVPSWSPDSAFIVAAQHATVNTGEAPEDSPAFDIVASVVSGTLRARLIDDAGMWSVPQWLPSGQIIFGVAETPYASDASRYKLYRMDRDGSNRTLLYPALNDVGIDGLPEFTPSPDGRSLLVVYQGDLYIINLITNNVRRLTAESTISRPRWSK